MTDDDIDRIALQNAKEYLQGTGPWKLDEIGITSDDYLVKCFTKAIREAALGATVSDGWEDIATCAEGVSVLVWCECDRSGMKWITIADKEKDGQWFSEADGHVPAKGWRPLPATPTID